MSKVSHSAYNRKSITERGTISRHVYQHKSNIRMKCPEHLSYLHRSGAAAAEALAAPALPGAGRCYNSDRFSVNSHRWMEAWRDVVWTHFLFPVRIRAVVLWSCWRRWSLVALLFFTAHLFRTMTGSYYIVRFTTCTRSTSLIPG